MKGLSPLISMVLVLAFGFTAMTIVLTVVNPLLDRAKDSGLVNEATQNMQLLDSAIKAVASEAKGSKRTIHLKISEGVLRTNTTAEWVYFELEPKTRTILDGFSGDVKIESKPVFLEYFNQYNNNANANQTWASINGTWSISSGRFLGNGGIAYANVGNQTTFDFAAAIVRSSAPDGQVYVVPGDPRDLVMYLTFDGNVDTSINTTYDYSAYKNNGTLKNATSATCFTDNACPSWVSGKFGNATDYDGIGDFVNVSYSDSLNVSDENRFTVALWVRGTDMNREMHIFSKYNTDIMMRLNPAGESPRLSCFFTNTTSSSAEPRVGTSFENNTWMHIACAWDGSSFILYKDGVSVSTATRGGTVRFSNNPIGIGAQSKPGLTANVPFNGTIDEVMFFNRALTANEIAFLYETSIKKITPAGEIQTIPQDANVTIVLASPGSSYFDNVKLKSGPPKIRFVIPYQNIDIVNQTRFGPGDHNIVIRHYGTNMTSSRPMIGLEE